MSATLQSGADLQQPPQHHDLHNLNKIEASSVDETFLSDIPSADPVKQRRHIKGISILSIVQFRHCGRQAIVSGLLGRPKIQFYTCCKPSYNHSKFYSKGICEEDRKYSVINTSLLSADLYHSDGIRVLENLESESKTDNFCRGYFLHWP